MGCDALNFDGDLRAAMVSNFDHCACANLRSLKGCIHRSISGTKGAVSGRLELFEKCFDADDIHQRGWVGYRLEFGVARE